MASAPDPSFFAQRVDNYYRDREAPFERHLVRQCRIPAPDAVLLNGNDYLRLSNHPDIKAIHAQSISSGKTGLQMSGVFMGDDETHPKSIFESRFADFLGFEGSVLCQSGYAANDGLIQSVASPDIPVYVDQYAHASFQAGVNSARATLRMFRHNSPDSLLIQIKKHGQGVIAVDTIYSTQGTEAPLAAIIEIARNFDCLFIVDESHSFGTHGIEGRGLIYDYQMQSYTHFLTVSFAKTMVTRAGIVCGSLRNINYLRYNSLPAIFSSVTEPHEAIRCSAVLDVIQRADDRRERLKSNTRYLRAGLESVGYSLQGDSQIIAIHTGSEQDLIVYADALESNGVFGAPFVYPATPLRKPIYRLSAHSELTKDEMDRVIAVCEEAKDVLPQYRKRRLKLALGSKE